MSQLKGVKPKMREQIKKWCKLAMSVKVKSVKQGLGLFRVSTVNVRVLHGFLQAFAAKIFVLLSCVVTGSVLWSRNMDDDEERSL